MPSGPTESGNCAHPDSEASQSTLVPLPSALAGIGALVLGGIVTAALLLPRPR
jgi:hypothetical protein